MIRPRCQPKLDFQKISFSLFSYFHFLFNYIIIVGKHIFQSNYLKKLIVFYEGRRYYGFGSIAQNY